MFDRIAPVYDAMNRVMTAGLDRRWRRITIDETVRAGDRVLDACCGTGDLAIAARARGADVVGLDFSERMLERARREGARDRVGPGRRARASVRGRVVRRGRPSASASATSTISKRACASCGACCARAAGSGSSRSRCRAAGSRRSTACGSTASCPRSARCCPAASAYTYLPASVRRFPPPDELAALLERCGFERVRYRHVRRGYRRAARGRGRLSTTLVGDPRGRRSRGVPRRDRGAARAHRSRAIPGSSRRSGTRRSPPAASGCGRCSSSSRRRRASEPSLAAGVAVELVHMATLVHDDLIDRAHFRRGKAAAWSVYGADAARATGDYLFARAFAELAATGDVEAVQVLADSTLALARGEALQRTQTNDPSTTVEAYIERCALKTGALFEAACRLGGGSGQYGIALGVAFQIADDVLDCSGATIETGQDRRHRPARRHADAAAPPRRAGGRSRPRGARRRPARGCARARCCNRCARTLPRGCPGLR